MLLALLLAACGCPDFSEVEILDATGELSEEERSELEETLAWFQDSTGLAGVCVDEVVVEEELVVWGEELAGHIDTWTHRIRLEHHGDMDRVLVHELCHGAAEALGHPEQDHAELFDPDSVDPDLYHSERARIEEAFADACEWGPLDLQITQVVWEQCGAELDTRVNEFLLDEIYTQVEIPPVQVEASTLATEADWELEELLGGSYPHAIASTDSTVAVLVAGWPHPVADEDGVGSRQPMALLHIDPWTRSIVSETRLHLPWLPDLALLDGQDAAWLVTISPSGQTWLDRFPVDGGVERMAFPPLDSLSGGGLVRDGTAWIFDAYRAETGWHTAIAVDLETLAVDLEPPFLEHDGSGLGPHVVATSDGPWLALWGDYPECFLVSLDGTQVQPSTWHRPVAWADDGTLYGWDDGGLRRASPDGSQLDIEVVCDSIDWDTASTLQVGDSAWLAVREELGTGLTLRWLPL